MAQDRNPDSPTDAAAAYRTARRPGQSGQETERRAGPSPLSSNPTGPHAPYEPEDPEGLAAAKHVREGDATANPAEQPPKTGLQSENFSILGRDS